MACDDNATAMWRLAKVVMGFGLLACGIVMLVLPGPGVLVIFAALTMLAAEFVWARRVLTQVKRIGAGRFAANRADRKEPCANR